MESIKELTKYLKLSYINKNIENELSEAKNLAKSYEEFLFDILNNESNYRKINGINSRIRDAKFPQRKSLDDFEKSKFKPEVKKKFEELETLNFIDKKENIILLSNPGMGKTHYSIGLAIKAIMANKRVLFISIPNLVIEIKEALSLNQITNIRKKFERYDLIVLDELGYVSFDKEGTEILFNLISNRINIGSILITTNLSFDKWIEIFKDPILTTAIVDRLAHKSHIINMSGDSYRIEDTLRWLKTKD